MVAGVLVVLVALVVVLVLLLVDESSRGGTSGSFDQTSCRDYAAVLAIWIQMRPVGVARKTDLELQRLCLGTDLEIRKILFPRNCPTKKETDSRQQKKSLIARLH